MHKLQQSFFPINQILYFFFICAVQSTDSDDQSEFSIQHTRNVVAIMLYISQADDKVYKCTQMPF